MRFFGIEIERKTDILAFAAFLLSLGGIVYQLYGFFRGPEVRLFAPSQVLIRAHRYPGQAKEYVRLAARMAYVNRGQLDYGAVIKNESIRYSLNGKTYEQAGQEWGLFRAEGDELVHEDPEDAKPFPIGGGSAQSHETYFAPQVVRCTGTGPPCDPAQNFLLFDQFVDGLAKLKEWPVTVQAAVYGERGLKEATCVIQVDKQLIERLNQRRWAAPQCWED